MARTALIFCNVSTYPCGRTIVTVQQHSIDVTGMTCDACERHVTDALEAGGAEAATADFRCGLATAAVPAEVDEAALAAAIRQAGYEPGAIRALEVPAQPRAVGSGDNFNLAII